MSIYSDGEVAYPGPLSIGDRGLNVKRLQEWLCLQPGASMIMIDQEFGPLTQMALRSYQATRVEITGILDPFTWKLLTDAMVKAFALIPPNGLTLSQMLVKVAVVHQGKKPREVGGDNRGTWVRSYMAGRDGPSWPWCAGFVTTLLEQACESIGVASPYGWVPGCDTLAGMARSLGKFHTEVASVKPGDIFLVPKNPEATLWQHTGIVEWVELIGGVSMLHTIEGNSNEDGSSNGWEVVCGLRKASGKGFISI